MKPTEIERFWAKTIPLGACIVWTGHVNSVSGYGDFMARDPASKRRDGFKTVLVHRYIYQRITGYRLPRNMDVMHSCDTRHCVALHHLSHGSRTANMRDAVKKGRMARGEQRSKLTEVQVLEIRALCAAGESQVSVAKKFGIHQVTVSKILTGKHWKHI
jgi:hypothetical protein